MSIFWGVFFWSLVDRNGTIFKPLKGGETLVTFLLAACRPQFSDFKPLKEGEMLDNFFLGAFLSLSVPKCTLPTPNSIEFGAGKVHFWFGSADCLASRCPSPHLARAAG